MFFRTWSDSLRTDGSRSDATMIHSDAGVKKELVVEAEVVVVVVVAAVFCASPVGGDKTDRLSVKSDIAM